MAQSTLDCSEIVLDILCYVRGQEVPGISLERRTIWTNQELLKIPGDVSPLDWLPDQELWIRHQTILNMKGVKMIKYEKYLKIPGHH